MMGDTLRSVKTNAPSSATVDTRFSTGIPNEQGAADNTRHSLPVSIPLPHRRGSVFDRAGSIQNERYCQTEYIIALLLYLYGLAKWRSGLFVAFAQSVPSGRNNRFSACPSAIPPTSPGPTFGVSTLTIDRRSYHRQRSCYSFNFDRRRTVRYLSRSNHRGTHTRSTRIAPTLGSHDIEERVDRSCLLGGEKFSGTGFTPSVFVCDALHDTLAGGGIFDI